MSKQGKYFILKIAIGILALIFITSESKSRVTANWSDCGIEPGCDGSERISGMGINLGVYVVQGAGHFLTSYSAWNTFLTRVEMSELNGLDYRELREVLYTAIEGMEKANAIYMELKTAADKSAKKA